MNSITKRLLLTLAATLVVISCQSPVGQNAGTKNPADPVVSGTLTDQSGVPVPAFEITVLETGAKTTTASDGKFSLTLGNGTFHLYVTTDYSNALSELLLFRPQTVTFSGQAINLGPWTAGQPSTVGRAISGDTGFPGLVVTVASLTHPTVVLATAITSSDEASFAFFDLPLGEYVVKGSGPEVALDLTQIRLTETYKNGADVVVTNVYDGTAYSSYDHDSTDWWSVGGGPIVVPNSSVSGTVRDEDTNLVVPGLIIQLWDDSSRLVATTTTAADGTYSLPFYVVSSATGTIFSLSIPAQGPYPNEYRESFSFSDPGSYPVDRWVGTGA